MNNFLSKINFSIRKPKIIIVTGNSKNFATEFIFQVLKNQTKIRKITEDKLPLNFDKNEVLLLASDLKTSESLNVSKFLLKNSSLPILLATNIGIIPVDKDFFAGERENTAAIRELAKNLPAFGYLILNFDDEAVREIKKETNLKELTFGFQEGADFRASDINVNNGINFKLIFQGNTVPIWLDKSFDKEQIYSALAAICIGTIFNLNLVEISQILKQG